MKLDTCLKIMSIMAHGVTKLSGEREAGFRFLLPVSKISKWPRLGLLDIRHDWFRYTLLLIVHPRLRTLGNLGVPGLYQDAESESRTVHEMSE